MESPDGATITSTKKIWFITSRARGLGRATTEAVLEAGHSVVATARRPESLDAVLVRSSISCLLIEKHRRR